MTLSRHIAAAALLLGLAASPAVADTLCSAPGAHPDSLDVSDVTLEGINSTDCYGIVAGNNQLAVANTLNLWGAGWLHELKDEDDDPILSKEFDGFLWEIGPTDLDDTSGDWHLTLTDVGAPNTLPIYMDLIVVLKGGPNWAGYFFDDFEFATTGEYGGTFTIKLKVGNPTNPQTPGLSHLSVYFRGGDAPDDPPCLDCDPTPHLDPVPEPASLLLLGTGLAGVAANARKRFRKQ